MLWNCTCSLAYGEVPTTPGKLTLYYEDRIPYVVPVMGEGLIGFIASRVTSVMEDAGIPYEWSLLPYQFQQDTLKRNQKPACAIGAFKTRAREEYLLYSKPIYQNRPLVIFANHINNFSSYKNIRSLLADKQKRLLVKRGYAYGNYLDRIIKEENPTLSHSDKRNVGMMNEVLAGKADYLIGVPEELEMLVKLMDLNPNQYQIIQFADITEGEYRHIACALNVGQATIDKINQSIDKLSGGWNKIH